MGDGEPVESEKDIRLRLGIPEDAARVMVFAESSHWDPDWLLTSEEYYSLRITRIMDKALRVLQADPRRVFSIESIFFFKMYWDRNPGRHRTLRALANEGRLRFSGTGFTQPDTMIPSTEAIIRDYQMGQQWLHDNGIEARPRVAYMADDFGLSPAFPSICRSLGIDYVAGSRIDGHFFPGGEYSLPGKYPLPGSSAELLLKKLKSTEIVWLGPDDSEVIYHLNIMTYDLGGFIALRGVARWMGIPVGIPTRSERHVARMIRWFTGQLSPYSVTPYMFCPIGGDFNSPITHLTAMLDRYNTTRYPDSGVYVVLACLEDYMDLVAWHRDSLPRAALDPNPNFMGFYFSRPKLKEGCRTLVSRLLAAEKMIFFSGDAPGSALSVQQKMASAWETAVVTNHHDFITGTAPNRVYDKEQVPWVRDANLLASEALESALSVAPAANETVEPTSLSAPSWSLRGGVLTVESPHYNVELVEERGGCITSLTDSSSGTRVLSGCGNDLVLYRDSGGLWRMGCEFRGGKFTELGRASASPASLLAQEEDGALKVTVKSQLGPLWMTRLMWFTADHPLIWMRTLASLGDYRTLTCSFSTAFDPMVISMDVAGGVAERPLDKTYSPTFWSAQRFVHYRDRADRGGLALFSAVPATVSGRAGGRIEWVVARNARRERAFGFLPVVAFPANGADPSIQVTDYAVCATGPGDWRDNGLHLIAPQALTPPWRDPDAARIEALAGRAVVVDHPDVEVVAVKPAANGSGYVVRLFSWAGGPVTARLDAGPGRIKEASLCDARERDLGPVDVEEGRAVVRVSGNITSVRLLG